MAEQDESGRTPLVAMEESAQRLGRALIQGLPADAAFVLVVAHAGQRGHTTFVANIERESTIALIKELLTHLEANTIAPHGQPDHSANEPGGG